MGNLSIQQATIHHLLHLADNALIIGHRNSEWCGHGPILEQDIAVTNIALDFIGQARNFYQLAAQHIQENNLAALLGIQENVVTEDTLAYLRDAMDFKNALITELPNGDWAQTILRQFFFSTYQYYYYQQLQHHTDNQIAAIAAKSLKEVAYHLKWSADWVIRLGDGTEESHQRMLNALDLLWPYVQELYHLESWETGVDASQLKESMQQKIKDVFTEATLEVPVYTQWFQQGGRNGVHTEHLGYILAEMQFLQRAYPGCEW